MIYRILTIIIVVIFFVITVTVWLWYHDPHYLINWWNHKIKLECDEQDAHPLNGIPSYHDAWDSPNKTATELHGLIHISHDNILNEVTELLRNCTDQTSISDNCFKSDGKWHPIWVRFMGKWTEPANNLPFLRKIVDMFPEVSNLYISVFYPGNTIIDNVGISRIFHRYNYGLSVPNNDIGLKISGYDVKWKEKEGFIWDDTLTHSVWNHTVESRIIICADIFRDLSGLNSLGSNMIYSVLQHTDNVANIKSHLKYQRISSI